MAERRAKPFEIALMQTEISWLAQALLNFEPIQPGRRFNEETSFTRGDFSRSFLNQTKLPETPNVLIAGLGRDTEPFICSYLPFIFSAYLEKRRPEYRLSLIDISPQVIEDVRTREKIFLCPDMFHEGRKKKLQEHWQQYLDNGTLTERVIHEPEEGLAFPS